MKKFLCFFVLLALCSCTDMNIKVQKIESPTDCVNNNGWSWNDGVAKTTSNGSSDDFEFRSKLSGILSFKYAFWQNSYYGSSYLAVYIDGIEGVYETGEEKDTLQVVIKNIPKNCLIKFNGKHCMVKDLIISSSLEENKQDEDTPPNDWF